MSETVDHGFEERFRARQAEAVRLSAELDEPSLMARLARLPADRRREILGRLSPVDAARLAYHWPAWARGKQNPDLARLPHRTLFWCSGRGFGKTLSAAQRFRQRHELGARVGSIIGPTHRKMEQYMIEGTEAAPGLLRIYPPDLRPNYLPHKGRIDFRLPPGVGGTPPVAFTHSAEDRDFRGSNLDTVWGDEIGEWPYLEELMMNIEMSTRARAPFPLELIFSSTPVKRRYIRELVEDPDTITIFGSTRENAANVDRSWLRKMTEKFGGTRRGREELEGEVLSDNPDALFSAARLDADRVRPDQIPDALRVVVAVDPGISSETGVDPTGVVVLGEDETTRHLYVLEDLTRDERATPEVWGADVVSAYERWKAVAVVAETNRGGDLVTANIRAVMREKSGALAAQSIPIQRVHATRGKVIRAEPVSALHERRLIHVVGAMRELEAEITEWSPSEPGPSPNRLDALVWGVYYLANLEGEERVDPRRGVTGYAEHVARVTATSADPPGRLPDLTRPLVQQRPLAPRNRGRIA
jgi:phage terminase large subunit-like protein